MMFRRWHTGHSLGAGVLGGLLLSQHAWTIAVLAFTLGLTAGSFAYLLRGLADRLRRKPFFRPDLYDQEPPLYVPKEFALRIRDARNGRLERLDYAEALRSSITPDGKLTATDEPGVRVDESGREWYSAAWI